MGVQNIQRLLESMETTSTLTFPGNVTINGTLAAAAGTGVGGVLYVSASGIDRSTTAQLNIGPANATSVVITPATTVTGALTASSTIGATGLITASAGVALADNMNISVSNNTGSRFGNNISKIGFFGKTPVVSQTNIANVTNDDNSNINTVIQTVNAIADCLRTFGLVGVT